MPSFRRAVWSCLAAVLASAPLAAAPVLDTAEPGTSDDEPAPPVVAPATGQTTIDLLLQLPAQDARRAEVRAEPVRRGEPEGRALVPPVSDRPAIRPAAAASSARGARPTPDNELTSALLEQLKSGVRAIRPQFMESDPAELERRRSLEHERAQRHPRLAADGTAWGRAAEDAGGALWRRAGGSSVLLDWPFFRFIRENRMWVVAGSIAALVAIWATANLSLHRRRR